MKNIHVLPTDKPSRLATHYEKMRLIQTPDMWTYEFTKQNIYITSDEEIKEGDCILLPNNEIIILPTGLVQIPLNNFIRGYSLSDCKKIILTTDQYLINDGVQAINDEFLEWFVKNPSCERIEFTPYLKDIIDPVTNIKYPSVQFGHFDETKMIFRYHYELIVPKDNELKIGDNTNFGIVTDINEKSVCFGKNKIGVDVWYKKSDVIKFPKLVLEEPTEKTLEEFAENYLNKFYSNYVFKDLLKPLLIDGAKWQAERMYSKEEVKHLMTLAFEQGFKKADVVEAGLEAKETDTEVNWIFLKHKK